MDIYKFNFTSLEWGIFLYLSWRAGEKLSQRELALDLGVSPTAVANSLKKLKKLSYVRVDKVKNINFVTFNRENREVLEVKRTENLKYLYKSKLIEYLKDSLAGSTVVLFGSYSRGEDTVKSDIDIAIVGRKRKELKLEKYEKLLNRRINAGFYLSWKEINKELKNNLLNGIVLVGGIEL